MMTPEQKYFSDLNYHAVVDMLVKFILDYEFTPSEVREMAVFAAVRAESLKSYERKFAENFKFATKKKEGASG